jgi:hypothetical protein
MRRVSVAASIRTSILIDCARRGLSLNAMYLDIKDRLGIANLSALEEIELREAYLLIKKSIERHSENLEVTEDGIRET